MRHFSYYKFPSNHWILPETTKNNYKRTRSKLNRSLFSHFAVTFRTFALLCHFSHFAKVRKVTVRKVTLFIQFFWENCETYKKCEIAKMRKLTPECENWHLSAKSAITLLIFVLFTLEISDVSQHIQITYCNK